MSRTVKLPANMEPMRYEAPREIEIPDGQSIPLVGGPNDAPEKQVKERLIAHAKCFDLSDPEQNTEFEAIWQLYGDGAAMVQEHRIDFNPSTGKYTAFARWFTYKNLLPEKLA